MIQIDKIGKGIDASCQFYVCTPGTLTKICKPRYGTLITIVQSKPALLKHIYSHSTAQSPKESVCHLGQKLWALTQPESVIALSTAISAKLINFPLSE